MINNLKSRVIRKSKNMIHRFRIHIDEKPKIKKFIIGILENMPDSSRSKLKKIAGSNKPDFTIINYSELSLQSREVYNRLQKAMEKERKL